MSITTATTTAAAAAAAAAVLMCFTGRARDGGVAVNGSLSSVVLSPDLRIMTVARRRSRQHCKSSFGLARNREANGIFNGSNAVRLHLQIFKVSEETAPAGPTHPRWPLVCYCVSSKCGWIGHCPSTPVHSSRSSGCRRRCRRRRRNSLVCRLSRRN